MWSLVTERVKFNELFHLSRVACRLSSHGDVEHDSEISTFLSRRCHTLSVEFWRSDKINKLKISSRLPWNSNMTFVSNYFSEIQRTTQSWIFSFFGTSSRLFDGEDGEREMINFWYSILEECQVAFKWRWRKRKASLIQRVKLFFTMKNSRAIVLILFSSRATSSRERGRNREHGEVISW